MAREQGEHARSIREIGALVRSLVEPETTGYTFWVKGVVQNFRPSERGHLYFDLRDDDHLIRCIVRERLRKTLDFTFTNDTEIEVFGSVGVYQQQARAQIEVENVRLVHRQPFILDEGTRQKLEQMGLWPKTKRPLPQSLRRVGLITSEYSEAYYDFKANYEREGGAAEIELSNIRLQGKDAAHQISEAISKYNNLRDVDVIILMRGGGSQADLALFNDITIAEAICRSVIPVITGIGHQRDETLADQVADLQESTPTAVAFRLASLSQQSVKSPKIPWASFLIVVVAILAILGLLIALVARQ